MANLQAPRGTQDVFGFEMEKWHYLENLIRDFTQVYNYQEIRTPVFEHTEVFKRDNDSSDMVNKEMYTFIDAGQRSLTLRPEGTAGIIRSYVENKLYGLPDQPIKCYYIAPNFRYERPQKGRMRIHHQFGVEVIGVKNPVVDAEVIALGYSFVKALGLKDLKVLVNTLGDEESRNNYRAALLEHFKPEINNLCEDCQRRYVQNPLRILDCKVDKDHKALKSAPKLQDYLNQESKEYFEELLKCLETLEIPYQIEDRLVRGLDYYCHTVFEVISVNADMGAQSTIFGGGRYDKLVEYFNGPSLSGIGFGMGIERLLVALESEGIEFEEDDGLDVYIMPLEAKYQAYCLELATIIRANGYRCDLDYAGKNFKAMFKSAERKKASVVIIVGENEYNNNQLTLKQISSQNQVSVLKEEMIEQLDKWLNQEGATC